MQSAAAQRKYSCHYDKKARASLAGREEEYAMLRSLLSCHFPSEPEFVASLGSVNAIAAENCISGALARGFSAVAGRFSRAGRMTPDARAGGVRPPGLDNLSMELIAHIGRYLPHRDLLRLSSANKKLNQQLKMQRDSIILTGSLARRCGYPRVVMLVGKETVPGVLAAFPPHCQLAPVLRIIERVGPPDEAAAEFIYQRLSLMIKAWPVSLQNQGWPALSLHRLRDLPAPALAGACKDLLLAAPALSTASREQVADNILYHFRLLAQRDRGGIMLRLLAQAGSYGRTAREAVLIGLSLDIFHLCPLHMLPALDALLAAALTLAVGGRVRVLRELRCQLPHVELHGLDHKVTNRLVAAGRSLMEKKHYQPI
ncbi:hypothetical protein [Acerihabitans arboris]|uniref:F-box domain-containing protein n=1 Tax=Acerihabitans arboris TaxID=2691583 RepID=A0A845SH93_9GAMM|nr:hypothetical protein [Acerihabitans arboris]NDL62304.1 hypothetical protein [Acerihabitans arboris]